MERWEDLERSCLTCTACGLAATRTKTVFGVGSRTSGVMFVGEGPGEQEDLTGEPFVGRAGKLLDKYLASIGLDREHVYITNMVKCRPPHNRDPLPEETEQCIGHLRAQVRLLAPKIIVCLGRVAACRLIDPAFKVTRQHGEWRQKNGVLMMGTFHPAALLRNPTQKPAAFKDFLKLRDKLCELGLHPAPEDFV